MLTKRRSHPQFASRRGVRGAEAGALSRLAPTVLECGSFLIKFMIEKKSRILIADDFEELRTALTLMLKYAGFDVIEVENGRQAIEAAHQEEPDLILMDVTLPVVDGLQATREIRSDQKFERLPIIILSAHDSDEIRQQAAEAGGSEYISKPLEFAELKKLIDGCLTVN
jgi:DNA-binding response OmpR family regulator